MGQNSSLKNKLDQHQFDYRTGAWESMESLLDAAAPLPKPKSTRLFSKWLGWLGAAAVFACITFWGLHIFKTQEIVTSPAPSLIEQGMEQKQNEVSSTNSVVPAPANTNKVEKKSDTFKESDGLNNNKTSTTPAITPKEYQSVSPNHQVKKSSQHAEPVDDSKVYRENSNHKKPHQHIDEHSKAPAASDLHHN
jgi:hypothetical protein